MEQNSIRKLYVDLLRRSVSGEVVQDPPKVAFTSLGWGDWFRPKRYDQALRDVGKDWPSLAHTMIGARRLQNLQRCIEEVLADDVAGDFIETGVWRGGASIFMRGLLKAHGVTDRRIWVADSFEGLPRPNPKKYPMDRWLKLHLIPYLAVSQDEVAANFAKYDLLDDQVCFLKGWFRDSLPVAPIDSLAVLRLDGDLYESTSDALNHLYPKLSVGGYVIVDDYAVAACAQAVKDYREQHQIHDVIVDIDGTGAFWRRTA